MYLYKLLSYNLCKNLYQSSNDNNNNNNHNHYHNNNDNNLWKSKYVLRFDQSVTVGMQCKPMFLFLAQLQVLSQLFHPNQSFL